MDPFGRVSARTSPLCIPGPRSARSEASDLWNSHTLFHRHSPRIRGAREAQGSESGLTLLLPQDSAGIRIPARQTATSFHQRFGLDELPHTIAGQSGFLTLIQSRDGPVRAQRRLCARAAASNVLDIRDAQTAANEYRRIVCGSKVIATQEAN